MSNYTRYWGEPCRGPSPIIFGDVAKLQHDQIMGRALVFYDDFAWIGSHASAQASGGYPTYQDTGVTITQKETIVDTNKELGVLEIANNDADNDEGQVVFGTPGAFALRTTSGNASKVMFEARINKSGIGDNGLAFFVGLGSLAPAADNLVNNTGALAATLSCLGFQCLQDDGDQVDIVYQETGQTKQTVLANAVQLTANTYVKLGFIFDPNSLDPAKTVKFYIASDGLQPTEQSVYLNTTQVTAATFPDDSLLSPVLYTKTGAAAEVKARLDVITAAMLFNAVE